MNRKQFGILLVALAVLGGAGWLAENNRHQESAAGGAGAGQKLLGANFPVNDVAEITIQQGTNQLDLAKKNNLWRVHERNDYPAAFSQISEFLIKVGDLKVIQTETVGASQLPRLQLAPPGQGSNSATVVEFKDKDGKALGSLRLGKQHLRKAERGSPFGDAGFPDGRYVMTTPDSPNALLIADPLTGIEPRPEQWLNKDFFHVERPKAIAVTYPEATNSWKITRETDTGDWKFVDEKPGEKLDSARASGVTNPFSAASFSDVVSSAAKPEDTGLDKPTVITVDTFDDFSYTVKIGRKTNDDYNLNMAVVANFPKERVPLKDEKPEDKAKADKAYQDRQKQIEDKLKDTKPYEQWTYLVPSYVVDPLLKTRKDLIAEKKDDPKVPDAAGKADEKKDDAGSPILNFDPLSPPK